MNKKEFEDFVREQESPECFAIFEQITQNKGRFAQLLDAIAKKVSSLFAEEGFTPRRISVEMLQSVRCRERSWWEAIVDGVGVSLLVGAFVSRGLDRSSFPSATLEDFKWGIYWAHFWWEYFDQRSQ